MAYYKQDPFIEKFTGWNINQDTEPWWVTSVRSYVAMCRSLSETYGPNKVYGKLAQEALVNGELHKIYSIYSDYMLKLEREMSKK